VGVVRSKGQTNDDDNFYLKKRLQREGVTKSKIQKYKPAKGISKRVNIQIIQDRQNSPTINNQNNPPMKKKRKTKT
jgi:hypothetical protein